jgi:hypothetical protein
MPSQPSHRDRGSGGCASRHDRLDFRDSGGVAWSESAYRTCAVCPPIMSVGLPLPVAALPGGIVTTTAVIAPCRSTPLPIVALINRESGYPAGVKSL